MYMRRQSRSAFQAFCPLEKSFGARANDVAGEIAAV
jgi:hypothetical protein